MLCRLQQQARHPQGAQHRAGRRLRLHARRPAYRAGHDGHLDHRSAHGAPQRGQHVGTGVVQQRQSVAKGTFRYTFTIPGTYTYICQVHSNMIGRIIVTTPTPPSTSAP
jgi:hypothetical protein